MYLKLKELRLSQGLSVEKMGDKIGISRAFYWQIESGRRRLSYDMAIRIASVFKLKPDFLFYDDHIKSKEN